MGIWHTAFYTCKISLYSIVPSSRNSETWILNLILYLLVPTTADYYYDDDDDDEDDDYLDDDIDI